MSYYVNALDIRKAMDIATNNLSDEVALMTVSLFRKWQPDTVYLVDDRVQHESILYKCIQSHTSQSDWTPDITPSLFARVLIPDPEIIPEWIQPDSTNSYMIGDKVTHNDKTWVSDVDNNVWEPGIYGWTEITAK